MPIRGEAWPESLEGEGIHPQRAIYDFHVLKNVDSVTKTRFLSQDPEKERVLAPLAFGETPGFAKPSKTHKYPVKMRDAYISREQTGKKNQWQYDI